jgi:hypothetical protein
MGSNKEHEKNKENRRLFILIAATRAELNAQLLEALLR